MLISIKRMGGILLAVVVVVAGRAHGALEMLTVRREVFLHSFCKTPQIIFTFFTIQIYNVKHWENTLNANGMGFVL